MMHVIISEGLYDKEFVEKWTVGFDQLGARVSDHPPEWAEKVTWVPAEEIKRAARLFAETRPATLEWGVGLEHTPNCLQTVRAVGLLPGITGNIDVPGGFILGMHAVNDPDMLAGNLSDEIKDKRMGADRFKVLCSRDALIGSAHIPTLFEAMRTGKPYPVKAFLVFGNNGLVTYASSKQVHESFMSLDFLSVMDLYMTPTAELADIVLPAATWLELDQVCGFPLVAGNVGLVTRKVAQIGECRQDEEVFVDLARRLHLEVGTESIHEVYDRQLAPRGLTFEEAKEKGFVSVPFKYRKYEEAGFMTQSGKVELASSYLESLGYDPLPYYEEPPESPYSAPELAKEYPLVLTSGGRIQQFFCSEHRQISSLRKQHPDPIVEINPDTAAGLGIQEDDWVWIETARGKIQQKAKLTPMDPRVVNVQYGWWFPEEEAPEYGVWKSNANVLTNIGPPHDPHLGTYQLRALLCRVYKAG